MGDPRAKSTTTLETRGSTTDSLNGRSVTKLTNSSTNKPRKIKIHKHIGTTQPQSKGKDDHKTRFVRSNTNTKKTYINKALV